jgi:hypothetical protein
MTLGSTVEAAGTFVKLGEVTAFGVKPNVPADCEDVSVGAYALELTPIDPGTAADPAPLVAPAPTAWVVLAAAGAARFVAEPAKPAPPAAPKPIIRPSFKLPVANAPIPPVIKPMVRGDNAPPETAVKPAPAIIGNSLLRLNASGNPVCGLMVRVVPFFRASA